MDAVSETGGPSAPPEENTMGELMKKGAKNTVHLVVTGLPTRQDAKALEKALKAVASAWGGKPSTRTKAKKADE